MDTVFLSPPLSSDPAVITLLNAPAGKAFLTELRKRRAPLPVLFQWLAVLFAELHPLAQNNVIEVFMEAKLEFPVLSWCTSLNMLQDEIENILHDIETPRWKKIHLLRRLFKRISQPQRAAFLYFLVQ